jgi:DNA-binding NtrC family response regulator
VPLRHFSSGAQNALRLHRWHGEWAELLTTVKNLALSALEEEISADDVALHPAERRWADRRPVAAAADVLRSTAARGP